MKGSGLGLDLEKMTHQAEEIHFDIFPRYNAKELGTEQRCLSDFSVYVKRLNLCYAMKLLANIMFRSW